MLSIKLSNFPFSVPEKRPGQMCTFLEHASFLGLIEFVWILCRIETVKIITPWYLLRFHRSLDQIESLRFFSFLWLYILTSSYLFSSYCASRFKSIEHRGPHRTICSEKSWRMILDWASKYCLSSSRIWPNSFKCEMIKPPINQYA